MFTRGSRVLRLGAVATFAPALVATSDDAASHLQFSYNVSQRLEGKRGSAPSRRVTTKEWLT